MIILIARIFRHKLFITVSWPIGELSLSSGRREKNLSKFSNIFLFFSLVYFTDSNDSTINSFVPTWWEITTAPSRKYWKRTRNSRWKTHWITLEGTRPPLAISAELKACPRYSATIATRDNSMAGKARFFSSVTFTFFPSPFLSATLLSSSHPSQFVTSWIIFVHTRPIYFHNTEHEECFFDRNRCTTIPSVTLLEMY